VLSSVLLIAILARPWLGLDDRYAKHRDTARLERELSATRSRIGALKQSLQVVKRRRGHRTAYELGIANVCDTLRSSRSLDRTNYASRQVTA